MSDTDRVAAAPSAAAKVDPETLVLRGRPRPVVRFRRGVIIALTAAVAATVIGVTWIALDSPSVRSPSDASQAERLRRPAAEALDDAPATYADVPRLGPPLPGDLGRPILDHRRSLESGLPSPSVEDSAQAERLRQAEAARERESASREAARASSLLVELQGGAAGRAETEAAAPPSAAAMDEVLSASDSAAQDQSRTARSGPAAGDGVSTHMLRPAPSRWTLSAGTIIPASLITGLNSDLPGIVLAQVTEPVRDSATGRTVLIPQGARLIGSYDDVVEFGQRRALVAWQRIVFPGGASVRLDDMPATDASGFAGVADRVDFHTGRLLRGIALSSLLGVGTELSLGSNESDLVRAIRESAQQSTARAGDQITARNLDIEPTIRVRPGWPIKAIVHRDLVLKPWSE